MLQYVHVARQSTVAAKLFDKNEILSFSADGMVLALFEDAQNVRFRTPAACATYCGGGSIGVRSAAANMIVRCEYSELFNAASVSFFVARRRVETCAAQGGKSRGMPVPTESGGLQEVGPGTQPGASPHLDPGYVYDLRRGDGNSDSFFIDDASFCDELMAKMEGRASSLLDGYTRHVRWDLCEVPRSRGEYALDLLALGMALRVYAPRAEWTPKWAIALALKLLWLRRHAGWLKSQVDGVRGALFRRLFKGTPAAIGKNVRNQGDAEQGVLLLHGLPRLIAWLRATGDLEQEALRVDHWRSYLGALEVWEAARCLEVACELFQSFEHEAAEVLGFYSRGVESFVAGEYARRGSREDGIFCGRTPAEYHLNMIAAEVMNRGLRECFERTSRKVVLVPSCMRGARASSCKARVRGVDMTCTACDPECAVNRVTGRMRKLGAQVYLVPHTSGFSRWLDRWEREPGVGVIAVACMLNIMPGGLEMRERRIAAQCVPLDYPGCRRHWDREGIPTAVNEDRLVQIMAMPLFT